MAGDRIQVRELDRLMVYGRTGGLAIYELIGIADGRTEVPEWVGVYESGLAAYRSRNFAAAIDLFQQVLAVQATDRPARIMLERCADYLKSPPGDDWDATSSMTMK